MSITGKGRIDGQGKAWWDAAENNLIPNHSRARLIEPRNCKNFVMEDVTISNPGFWGIHPYVCDGVRIENVVFSAPVTAPNTDGIDPDSCSNVIIRNFSAQCGDDAIAIKSGRDIEGRNFNVSSHDILIEGEWCISALGLLSFLLLIL